MPLDPQAADYLQQLAKIDAPDVTELTPEAARRSMLEATASLGPPDEVARVNSRTVPTSAGGLASRHYVPQTVAAGAPVLVFFHGGGFVIGDLDTHDGMCRAIANAAACHVVSVHYRRAPEHRFPAAAEDAFAAACWVRENAAELGADPDRVFVGGDSAGGNLSAVTALMVRDRGRPPLAGQILIYPVTDYRFDTSSYGEFRDGYMLTRGAMRWFWKQYLRDEADGALPYASPLRCGDLSRLPPALVITAECDPLRDEGEAYAHALERAGVPTILRRYDGMIHGFLRRLNAFDKARAALADLAAWLRRA
jgi:acetyl esterase